MFLRDKSKAELEAELLKAKDAIDAAYWAFTRQARANPPPQHLYKWRNSIEDELRRRVGLPMPLVPVDLVARHPWRSSYLLTLRCGHTVERQRQAILGRHMESPNRARCEECGPP